MADPSNLGALNECKFLTGCDVRIVLAPARGIQKAIERHYNARAKAYNDALTDLDGKRGLEVVRVEDTLDIAALQRATEEAPLVKLVNALMTDAVERRASDIHIEPFENDLRIRFRIDGDPLRHHAAAAALQGGARLAHQDHGLARHLGAAPAAGRRDQGQARRRPGESASASPRSRPSTARSSCCG